MQLVKELSVIGAVETLGFWTLFHGYFVRSLFFFPSLFFYLIFFVSRLLLNLLYTGRETEERDDPDRREE